MARKSHNRADACWWPDGTTALVKNGDPIIIDAEKRELTLNVSADELVAELVNKNGWKEADIQQFKELGMMYCRKRNSFTSPPQSLGI